VALIRCVLYGGGNGHERLLDAFAQLYEVPWVQVLPIADLDVWMREKPLDAREAVKSDGSQHSEYILLYVDDCLVISDNGEKILREEIGKYFKVKEASIDPPDIYLGGRCEELSSRMVRKNGP